MFRLACSFALLVFFVGSARAEVDVETERARSHVKAAIAYYDEGRYDDAAREMEVAYRLRPLPDLQYNLAQCYERLNKLPEAVAAYDKYLDGKPTADDREVVAARVKNLEARVKNVQDRVARDKAAPALPPAEKIVLKTVVVYREAPPLPGRWARYAAYGFGVIAAGGLAAGIAFAVLAKGHADEVTKGGNPQMPVPFGGAASQAQAAGQQDQVLSGVGFGVAAVGALGTVGLLLLAKRIDGEAEKLALSPSFGPTGGGLVLAGRF